VRRKLAGKFATERYFRLLLGYFGISKASTPIAGLRGARPQPWAAKLDGHQARQAVYGTRPRIRGEPGKELLRQRGELLERSFAHIYVFTKPTVCGT
jgi:hypothetical protein